MSGLCVDSTCDCDAVWDGEHCGHIALDGDGELAYGGPGSNINS